LKYLAVVEKHDSLKVIVEVRCLLVLMLMLKKMPFGSQGSIYNGLLLVENTG
jgi:hypothetical protein